MSPVPYPSIVRRIMHAMVCSRQDTSHDISVVSRYMHNLIKVHWQAVNWTLWYFRGTSIGLMRHIDDEKGCELVGYSNSYFTGNLDCRRSLTGCMFSLLDCVISWKASLQPTVA